MGQTYVITGANRGIGLELTRHLIDRGDRVIATARQPILANELQALGVKVEALDVTDPNSVRRFAAGLAREPVDVLLNNAGIGVGGAPFEKLDIDTMADYFQVNTMGPLRVTQALLPNLRLGKSKRIAQLTSRMGSIDDNESGGAYAYRASKAALNMVNKSLSIELAARGFVCVVLHPGWVQTDMGGNAAPTTVAESVAGLVQVLDDLGPQHNGGFYDFHGQEVPW